LPSLCNMLRIESFNSLEKCFGTRVMSYFPATIFLAKSRVDVPEKGGYSVASSYTRHPTAHTSELVLYGLPFTSSGDM
jgi:hypothetical protein